MCGIGGVMQFKGLGKTDAQTAALFSRYLSAALLIENESRGNHAAGIATFSARKQDVLKVPVSATELVMSKQFDTFVEERVNTATKNILVHTRWATQGRKEINDNNHPIVADQVIGVHNGCISNDDDLFAEHQLPRKAQVDSEVIFRMLDKFGTGEEGIKKTAESLQGMFTTAFVNVNEPHIMHIIRNDNPVTLAYIEELNMIVFASLGDYVRNAINYAEQKVFGTKGNLTVRPLVPKAETIWRFDTSREDVLEQFNQVPNTFEPSEEDWFSYGGRSGRSHSSSRPSWMKNLSYEEAVEYFGEAGANRMFPNLAAGGRELRTRTAGGRRR